MLDVKDLFSAYEFNVTLPGSGKTIKMRPFTTAQLKQIITSWNTTEEADLALDRLIASSVLDEDFNIDDLLVEDRFYLVYELRRKTKGSKYEFIWTCPECMNETPQILNLDNLEVVKPPKKLKKTVDLDDNISIELDFITRGVQKEAEKKANELTKRIQNPDHKMLEKTLEMGLWALALSIKKIITKTGEFSPTPEEAYDFITNMPEGLKDKIQDWYGSNQFGVKFVHNFKCSFGECRYSKEEAIPLDNFLF